jgi:hypothetical protein
VFLPGNHLPRLTLAGSIAESRFKKFGATRLMDVLTIESPWAFNVIADHVEFDRVLLARDYEEGVVLAKIPNIKFVLYKDGARETVSSTGGTTRAAAQSDGGTYDLGILVRERSPASAASQKEREVALRRASSHLHSVTAGMRGGAQVCFEEACRWSAHARIAGQTS